MNSAYLRDVIRDAAQPLANFLIEIGPSNARMIRLSYTDHGVRVSVEGDGPIPIGGIRSLTGAFQDAGWGFHCDLGNPRTPTWYHMDHPHTLSRVGYEEAPKRAEEPQVVIRRLGTEVEKLRRDAEKLRRLEAAGVDNWEGYSNALRDDDEDEDY